MSVIDQAAAQTEADTIKNETTPGANTHTRVGQMLRDLADSVQFGTVDGTTLQLLSAVLSVKDNGISNAKLRQGAACSLIGRSANSTGNVADIAAGADGHVLQRSSGSLSFSPLDLTAHFATCVRVETGSGAARGLVSYQASTDANGGQLVLEKSRGTSASPTAYAANDAIGRIVARAYDGSAFNDQGASTFYGTSAPGTSKQTGYKIEAHDGNAVVEVANVLPWSAATTDATPTIVQSIAIPASSMLSVAFAVHGIDASNNEAVREFVVVARRQGSGAASQIGTTADVIPLFKDDSAWGNGGLAIDVVVNPSTETFDVTVVGKAATNITWRGHSWIGKR